MVVTSTSTKYAPSHTNANPKTRETGRPRIARYVPRPSSYTVVVLIPPPVPAGLAPTAISSITTHAAARGHVAGDSTGQPSVHAFSDVVEVSTSTACVVGGWGFSLVGTSGQCSSASRPNPTRYTAAVIVSTT